ncbi:MAG: DUF3185 family protein [Opitutales bacterium]|nr:DUF3185 family protein [Opitutales bacterium]
MNRIIFLGILIVGIILIVLGFSAMDSFSSDVSRFFTGSPTDKSVWLLIGGVLLTMVGVGGTTLGGRRG